MTDLPDDAPLSELRGVVSFDTNESLLLVAAPVEAVAGAFAALKKLGRWEKDAYGKTVSAVAHPSYLVYRLNGHAWTTLDAFGGNDSLDPADAEALSKSLNARVLFYANSDTAGVTMYELFDRGRRLERFSYAEGELEFESTLRPSEGPGEDDDPYEFVDQFLKSQDALAPGWSSYAGGWRSKPDQPVTLNFFGDGFATELERLDFIAK